MTFTPKKDDSFPKVEQLPDGKVRIQYDNNELYEGEFSNNKKNGYGKFTWNNEATYEGSWLNDHAFGEGVFTQKGAVYKGYFENDELIRGVYTSADQNETYEG